jgi:hypothetical protein
MNRTSGAAQERDRPSAAVEAAGGPADHAGKIMISCYENDVPAFVEGELQRLYGSLYSSMAQFRIYYRGGDVSTYIAKEKDEIKTLFLFSREGEYVRVVNEVFEAREEDIRRFASYVFSTMPEVQVISFKSIWTGLLHLPYPFHRANHLEDYVVDLPSTADKYLAQLSGSSRRKLKRKIEKFEQDFPSARFEVREAAAIDECTMKTIIELNHTRMAGKNRLSLIDERETERMIRLAKECGMVAVVRIDERICAGAISFRSGSNYFLNAIAHDPAYDGHSLGTLCCYWTVCAAIERGAREFHFLWGRYDYKQTLLGVERNLDKIEIYRSRFAMVRHTAHVCAFAGRALRRRAQLWLYEARREDKLSARIALSCLDVMRRLGWGGRYG